MSFVWGCKEIQRALESPKKNLTAFRLCMEYSSISFYPTDIAGIEIQQPSPHFPSIKVAPELEKYYYAEYGVRMRFFSTADNLDRFDWKPDIIARGDSGTGFRYLSVFERLQKHPDILHIDLIYDRNYWRNRRGERFVMPEQFVEILLPYLAICDISESNERENILQHSWIDRDGCLNIEVISKELLERNNKAGVL